MSRCHSCGQYSSERACPVCGTDTKSRHSSRIPRSLDIHAIAASSRSEDTFLDSFNRGDPILRDTQFIERSVAVLCTEREAKTFLLGLPHVFENNTHHWLQFQNSRHEEGVRVKLRINFEFYSVNPTSGAVRLGSPVHELRFRMASGYLVASSVPLQEKVFNTLSDIGVTSRPLIILSRLETGSANHNSAIFPWNRSERAFNYLARSLVLAERGIRVDFVVDLIQRPLLALPAPGWNGVPTIQIVGQPNQGLKEENVTDLSFLPRSRLNEEARISIDNASGKCLGHGIKISPKEYFSYCLICQGPICCVCFKSFEDTLLCPGSVFGTIHSLPRPE